MIRRTVTDDEYRKALENQDNKRVMGKILSGYAHKLPEETLEECKHDALWYTLRNHNYEDPSGKKFTSSLHHFLHCYLRKALRKSRGITRRSEIAKDRELRRLREENKGSEPETEICLTTILSQLQPNYQTVLTLYYFRDLSFQQIADELSWPLEQVKIVHNNALVVCNRLGLVKMVSGSEIFKETDDVGSNYCGCDANLQATHCG